jgi:hypothetical protein
MSVGGSFIGVVKPVTFGVMEAGGNRRANLTELQHLLASQPVEEMLADALDVTWCSSFKSGEPGIGQDGELSSAVGCAELAPNPAVLLESRNSVREPASRRKRSIGQRAHTQPTVGDLGEPHQNLVVGVRHAAVALQFLIEPVSEQLGRLNVGPPDDLLLGTEPSRSDRLGSLQRH